MSENDLLAVSIFYSVFMIITLGVLLAKRADKNEPANLGDLIASLLWPAFLFLCLGYLLGKDE